MTIAPRINSNKSPKTPKPPTKDKKAQQKDNEIPWHPSFSSHVYLGRGHTQEQILVEPPVSHDGVRGTHKFSVQGMEHVVKVAPNEVLNDPTIIHQYLENTHDGRFGDDSLKTCAFK